MQYHLIPILVIATAGETCLRQAPTAKIVRQARTTYEPTELSLCFQAILLVQSNLDITISILH